MKRNVAVVSPVSRVRSSKPTLARQFATGLSHDRLALDFENWKFSAFAKHKKIIDFYSLL